MSKFEEIFESVMIEAKTQDTFTLTFTTEGEPGSIDRITGKEKEAETVDEQLLKSQISSLVDSYPSITTSTNGLNTTVTIKFSEQAMDSLSKYYPGTSLRKNVRKGVMEYFKNRYFGPKYSWPITDIKFK